MLANEMQSIRFTNKNATEPKDLFNLRQLKTEFMKAKLLLYLGILLLVIGIVLRTMGLLGIIPWFIIIAGASCKILYMASVMKKGAYKLGAEMFLLYGGLLLFFSGMYLKSDFFVDNARILVPLGICFKVAFVLVFIWKVRQRKKESANSQA